MTVGGNSDSGYGGAIDELRTTTNEGIVNITELRIKRAIYKTELRQVSGRSNEVAGGKERNIAEFPGRSVAGRSNIGKIRGICFNDHLAHPNEQMGQCAAFPGGGAAGKVVNTGFNADGHICGKHRGK